MFSFRHTARAFVKRTVHIRSSKLNTTATGAVDAPRKDVQSEEEISQKRNVSRLPLRAYTRGIKKEYPEPKYEYDFTIKAMQRSYAKFGESSGINPGIMWPSKEELQEKIYYEKKFQPTIQELLANEKEKQRLAAEEIRQREEEVERNMAKLDAWREAMLEREEQKRVKAEQERIKKEQLVQEVREYIGYNVDLGDPKFKEVMEMKEEERKKAEKEARKKLKQERVLARLMAVSEEPAVESKPVADKAESKE
ncbi:large ribosomal subunit protein mL64-like [Ornithodoros turicata]|uniref:large ribosomal subunit protein mL64-like n=1 Tax=Ornithodoros turicata TaxID=34597 RepID=UPI00313A3F39